MRATKRSLLLAAACALCWIAFPAQASDDTRANRLFVEAVKSIRAAEGETGAPRKLELLKTARRKLEAIVDRHPSSGLAVKLASGQNVGTVSLADLDAAIKAATVHACPRAPTPACVLSMALATAEKIKNAFDRSLAFAGIAAAQAKSGNDRAAEETLATALATAEKIKVASLRPWVLAGVAEAQAGMGHIADALATAEKTEVAYLRSWVLAGVAEAQAGMGHIADALATAEKIETAHARSWAFAGIAAARAGMGHIPDALATAEEIEAADARSWAFAGIAAARAKWGNDRAAEETLATALATAEKIAAESLFRDEQTNALDAVRRLFRRYGMSRDQERWMAADLAEFFSQILASRAFAGIAEAQAKMGHIADALATAEKIEDAGTRSGAFAGIAAAQAKSGNGRAAEEIFATAFADAEKIKDAGDRSLAFVGIAAALIEAE